MSLGFAISAANARNTANGYVEQINDLHVKLGDAYNKLNTYQKFLNAKAEGEAVNEHLEILGVVRPDLVPANADILTKQIINLKLFAWTEWWQQTLFGQSRLGENDAPVLRGLSEAMEHGALKQAESAAAASALKDLAARMEMTMEMEDGTAWVEKRIYEMWKTAKFQENDPTIPVPGSFAQVVPNLIQYEKRTGEAFDPFGENLYGINTMAVR